MGRSPPTSAPWPWLCACADTRPEVAIVAAIKLPTTKRAIDAATSMPEKEGTDVTTQKRYYDVINTSNYKPILRNNRFSSRWMCFGGGQDLVLQWFSSSFIRCIICIMGDYATAQLRLPCQNIDGLVQDCSISSALAMEILQPCTKSSI